MREVLISVAQLLSRLNDIADILQVRGDELDEGYILQGITGRILAEKWETAKELASRSSR